MRSLIDKITRIAIRIRWITLTITLAIIGAGIYSFTQLNQELLPDIAFPQTFTVAQNNGASSDNILHMYAIPFENGAEDVDGVVNIETTSREGFFIGIARNEFGLDQEQVTEDVREVVNDINNDLPLRRLAPPSGSSAEDMIGELSPDVLVWLEGYAVANNQLGFKQQLSAEVWQSFSVETLRALPVDRFSTLETSIRDDLLERRGEVSPEPEIPAWDEESPPALPESWNDEYGRITDASDLAEFASVRTLADIFNSLVEDGYVLGALGTTQDVTVEDIENILAIESRCIEFYDGNDQSVCSFINYLLEPVNIDDNPVATITALPQDSYNVISDSELYNDLPPHNPELAVTGLPLPAAWRMEPIEVVTFTFSDIPLASISLSLTEAGLADFSREQTVAFLSGLVDNGLLVIPTENNPDGLSASLYFTQQLDSEAITLLPEEDRITYLARVIESGLLALPPLEARTLSGDGFVLSPAEQTPEDYLVVLASRQMLATSNGLTPEAYLQRLVNNNLIPTMKDLENVANVTMVGGDTVQEIPIDVAIDAANLPTRVNGIEEAPELPGIWQNFVRLQTADQIIAFSQNDPQIGSPANFLNSFAIDPSGLQQNLLRALPAEVWIYLARNNPDGPEAFWNSLQPATYQSMNLAAVAKIPQAQEVVTVNYILPEEPLTRVDSESSLQIVIFKTQDANTVEAWDEVDEFLNDWGDENGVSVFVAFEQATFIEESISGVTSDGLTGALFATIIILIFMNLSIRSTLVTAISIPGSVMMALILMNLIPPNVNDLLTPVLEDVGRDTFFGGILEFVIRLFPATYTLNIMTLSGLTVAIGRVVDDSIVVLENIYRNVQQGEDQKEAILQGTREVSIAILAATVTTMFVFLPLGLFGGVTGAFFLPFGLAVVYSLVGSYTVAITTVPALASLLITRESMPDEGMIPITEDMGGYEKGLNRSKNVLIGTVGSLSVYYSRFIGFLLKNIFTRLGTIVVAIITLIFGMILLGQRPQTFLPEFGEPQITVEINLPAVTQTQNGFETVNIDNTITVVNDLEAYLLEQGESEGVEKVVTSIGGNAQQFDSRTDQVQPTTAVLQVAMASGEDRDDFIDTLRDEVASILEANGYGGENVDDYFSVSGIGLTGDFGGFALEIRGENPEAVTLAELRPYNDVIVATLEDVEGLVNLESSLTGFGGGEGSYVRIDGAPAIQYTAELESDDTLGITTEAIENVDEAVQDFREVQNEVTYTISEAEDGTLLVVFGLPETVEAEFMPAERASELASGLQQFLAQRESVSGVEVYSGTDAANFEVAEDGIQTLAVVQVMTTDAASLQTDVDGFVQNATTTTVPEVQISQGFDSEQQQEGFAQIAVSMLIATVIVYIILALTFGNLVHPFTILVSLPLSVVGAAVGLTVTGRVLSLSSMIGLLMLIGIVVANAVVFLDRVQQNRREKDMPTKDALVEAGSVRLRPILMTACTTIFGVFPLALGLTEGAIIAAELGTVVIGGLVSSTILTLIVLPVVYSLFDDLMKFFGGLFSNNQKAESVPGSD